MWIRSREDTVTKALIKAAARAASLGLVTIALVAGCSSTTSGTGSTGNGGGSGGGAGGGAGGGGGGSAAPTGGSGGGVSSTGNFCHDWSTISSDLSNVTAGNIGQKIVAKFDALAAEAPAAIKGDVQTVDAYVHEAMSGKMDPSKAQQLATSFEHIGQWMAQNC
jgi:hypothetical protein